MKQLLGLAVFFLGLPACAEEAKSYPAHVLLLRHAEKPPILAESADLSARGKERARALPELFKKSEARPAALPTPDFLFATKDTASSRRPRKTVAPLAESLGLKIDRRYAKDEFGRLAANLLSDPKYASKTVLICWHHGTLPDLARSLGAAGAPKGWKDAVFDRVWRIDYDAKGKAIFRDLPQRLLAGDSAK
jgi:hypothetical protein